MAIITDFVPTAAPIKARFAVWFADFIEASQRRQIYRTTATELQRLSKRDLEDLGVFREDIPTIARIAAYGH